MLRKYSFSFLCLLFLFSCGSPEKQSKDIHPTKPILRPIHTLPSFSKVFFPEKDIALLEENNFSLKRAFLNLENSRLTYEKSYSALYPTINAQLSGRRNEVNNVFMRNQTNYIASAEVAYTIDVFGRLSALKEQALHSLKSSEYNYEALFLANYLQYLQNYGQVIYTKNYETIALEQQKIAEQNFALVKLQYESGRINLSDYLTAEQNAQSQKTNAIKSKEAYILAKQAYALLLGKTDIEFENNLEYPSIENIPSVLNVPFSSIDKRPDVKASKELLEAARSNVDFATADLYPNLSLNFSFQNLSNTSLADVFTTKNFITSISGLLTQRLFDGGIRYKDLAISRNKANIAKLDYEETLINAVSNIEVNVKRLWQSKEVLTNAQKNKELALKSLQASQNSYENGVITLRDLLQTQNAYILARSNLLQAEKNIYDVYSLLLTSLVVKPIE